jgi:hypothetical protein
VQSKAGDALEVCRVVNGMWQVSGASWGRAEPAAAVDAMLRYADGGLATFDMADICKGIVVSPRVSRSGYGCLGATFARLSHSGFCICFFTFHILSRENQSVEQRSAPMSEMWYGNMLPFSYHQSINSLYFFSSVLLIF